MRNALGDADDRLDPGVDRATKVASAAKRAGTKTIEVFAPVWATASSTVSKTGIPLDVLAALARRDARDDLRAVAPVAEAVEGPLAAGEALHDKTGRAIDDDRH